MNIRRWIAVSAACILSLVSIGARASTTISLIPLPKSIEKGDGEFVFGDKLNAMVTPEAKALFEDFAKEFTAATNIKIKQVGKSTKAQLELHRSPSIAA